MPLTAFSKGTGEELDVMQALRRLARADGVEEPSGVENIPHHWRARIRADMECPSCFVDGAELVREAVSLKDKQRVVRQPCFRFAQYRPQCDFANGESAAVGAPENLITFGSERSALTRAVRQLVGSGIERGAFSQRIIRDMREWFFSQKTQHSFIVSLDPELAPRIAGVIRACGGRHFGPTISVTRELATLPGFDWRDAARWHLHAKYAPQLDAIAEARVPLLQVADRVATLARRHAGALAFDPSSLEWRYRGSQKLAAFIGGNFTPVARCLKQSELHQPPAVLLAFAALLLFVRGWDLDGGAALFTDVARACDSADSDLGNVIGLNPWHDFEAWKCLRCLQELDLDMPSVAESPRDELRTIEAALREKFAS